MLSSQLGFAVSATALLDAVEDDGDGGETDDCTTAGVDADFSAGGDGGPLLGERLFWLCGGFGDCVDGRGVFALAGYRVSM